MATNAQPSIDLEIDDASNSPFFTDIGSSTPVNAVGFSIPRPHSPIMDPEYAREMIAYLKELAAQSEPVQAI